MCYLSSTQLLTRSQLPAQIPYTTRSSSLRITPSGIMFSKLALVVAAAVATKTALAAPQLGNPPFSVCLTGFLGDTAEGLLDQLGVTVLDCTSDMTCTALDIPLLGGLLPIGVSFTSIHCLIALYRAFFGRRASEWQGRKGLACSSTR